MKTYQFIQLNYEFGNQEALCDGLNGLAVSGHRVVQVFFNQGGCKVLTEQEKQQPVHPKDIFDSTKSPVETDESLLDLILRCQKKPISKGTVQFLDGLHRQLTARGFLSPLQTEKLKETWNNLKDRPDVRTETSKSETASMEALTQGL